MRSHAMTQCHVCLTSLIRILANLSIAMKCTDLVVQKEKRSESFARSSYDFLSDDKRKKMKAFIDGYVCRLVKKLRERGKLQTHREEVDTPSNSASYSPQLDGNNSHNDDILSTVCLSDIAAVNENDDIRTIDRSETLLESLGDSRDLRKIRVQMPNQLPN